VVFDKTGTLTLGDPEVAAVVPANGRTEAEVLTFAAIAERRSEHPLAKAILKRAIAGNIAIDEPEQFQYLPGQGITCLRGDAQIVAGNRGFLEKHGIALNGVPSNGNGSEVYLAANGAFVGSILIADRLRPEAKDAIAALHKMGLRTALLTGDSKQIADAVAKEVGIETVYAEVLPHDKQKIIRDLRSKGERVAMVGDGINDAPALMEATVGIAMGSGTDVARESANVMLIGNDLIRLVETVQIARRCNRVIMQNFTGTLVVDAVGVALAAFGLLNPLFAAFIHVSSELAFILNSARLLPAAKQIEQ
jgi:P-type E1-E2 ATPase